MEANPTSAAARPPARGSVPRAMELLDAESQERVVLFCTRYRALLPLEQAAVMQELGMTSIDVDAGDGTGKALCRQSPRAAAVLGRADDHVVLQQSPVARPDDTPEDEAAPSGAAVSDLCLRRMLSPALFGEGGAEVPMRPTRATLYEKVGALEGDEEEAAKRRRAEEALAAEEQLRSLSLSTQRSTPGALGSDSRGVAMVPGEYLYRSRGYQLLRLALSPAHHINTNAAEESCHAGVTSGQKTTNVTGIPLYERELREWFFALGGRSRATDDESNDRVSVTDDGSLDLAEFVQQMRELERDFGTDAEYAAIEEEGRRLAQNGRLGFAAFAYIVLRFLRA